MSGNQIGFTVFAGVATFIVSATLAQDTGLKHSPWGYGFFTAIIVMFALAAITIRTTQ